VLLTGAADIQHAPWRSFAAYPNPTGGVPHPLGQHHPPDVQDFCWGVSQRIMQWNSYLRFSFI
jgi:hypothetical protein